MSYNNTKKKGFSMRSNFVIQEQPRRQWIVVQEFGKFAGGVNGGIAKVELKDDPIDRYFIEKRFAAKHVPDENYAEKEISLMYQLQDHENIVKMWDHFLDKKAVRASIYMELCDAGDMQDVINAVYHQNRHVPERTVWKWFIGCMDALVYIHYGPEPDNEVFSRKYWNQIYHRDLKPGNVFLKRDSQKKEIVAKLADFGCSISDQFTKINKDRTLASTTSAHTPGFDPPEHPDFSVATDVWQMALVIVCVCTGLGNPRSKTNKDGVDWDKQQPAGRQYTRELNDVLKWCLTVEQKRRPKSREVLKRLKEKYNKVKDSLPRDERPMDIFWQPRIDKPSSEAQQPASSPEPRAANSQQRFQQHRPGLSGHAFSDPGADRMEHMGNRYPGMIQHQRRPMSPNSIDEIVNGGGGHSQHGFSGGYGEPQLPGGFVPGFGSGQFPPGFGRGPPGFGRGGGSGFGRSFDPRDSPGWR
jgi:serine/threonine protein kinase